MLKIDLNHGYMNTFDFSGSVVELSADLALVFQLMYNEIRDKNGEEGKAMAEAFAGCVKNSIERAEKTANDIKRLQSIFKGKMDNLMNELKEAVKKAQATDPDDTVASDFSTDFHDFLYGEDDEE